MSQLYKDNTVTLVKAIGIILVVLGHALSSDMVVRKAIFTFHMPLFFLMSGYCFKEKYLSDAKQFVLRKIKGIYVPFIAFSLVFLALHNVFCTWYIYDHDWLYGWKDFAWNAGRIVTRMSHNEGLLGTFWFLKELFWGNVIFYLAYKVSKGHILPTVIGLFALTELSCIFSLRIPYFGISYLSTYAAFFIAFGYLWKISNWDCNKWWVYTIGVLSVVLVSLFSKHIAMSTQTPYSMLYHAIPAITGTMVLFSICRNIEPYLHWTMRTIILFIGDHTLSVMALHFLAFKLVSLVYIHNMRLPLERLTEFPVLYARQRMSGWLFTQ